MIPTPFPTMHQAPQLSLHGIVGLRGTIRGLKASGLEATFTVYHKS